LPIDGWPNTIPYMRRLVFLVGALVLLIGIVGMTGWLFFTPPTDEPGHADAVVVLGTGQEGERIKAAIALMDEGTAPILVLSEGGTRQAEQRALCAERASRFEVICFRADPFSTRGEARTVDALARAREWRSIVLVTSTYHVVRARMLFRRCYKGGLSVVGAHPSSGPIEAFRAIAHEWGGLVYALTSARGC
jgi:uncharacterized SAM-binding protein YcdF (DUF218 family)